MRVLSSQMAVFVIEFNRFKLFLIGFLACFALLYLVFFLQ